MVTEAFILFDLITIGMLFWGYKIKSLIKSFKKYVYVISSEHEGTLSNIAAILGKNENTVMKNIQKMINKSYFSNAYIDYRKKELMISGKALDKLKLSEAESTTCKTCGAYNINVIDDDSFCEYCGTILTKQKTKH